MVGDYDILPEREISRIPAGLVSGTGPRLRGDHPPDTQRQGRITERWNQTMIRKEQKTAVIEANRTHETDTDSPEV